MGGFDAKRYLRMLGEMELADHAPHSPWAGPVDHAAAALVAVGAIDVDDARSVLDEYGWVDESVGDGPAAGGRRVVALNADVRLPSGVLRLSHALLGDDETVIAASYRADPQRTGIYHDWIRVPSGWTSGLQPLLLADDRGARTPLMFHGSGNDDRWRATLLTESPIASDTSWIELSGTRIPCIGNGPAVRVTIKPVPTQTPPTGTCGGGWQGLIRGLSEGYRGRRSTRWSRAGRSSATILCSSRSRRCAAGCRVGTRDRRARPGSGRCMIHGPR